MGVRCGEDFVRTRGRFCLLVCVPLVAALAVVGFPDEIELHNGKRMQGKVVEKTPEFVSFRLGADAGTVVRIPAKNIRTIKIDEQRAKAGPADSGTPKATPAPPAAAPSTAAPPILKPPTTDHAAAQPQKLPAVGAAASLRPTNTRTKSEVEALIASAGATPPDWWDSVSLTYPKALNLTWAEPPRGEWNAQKNLGQYVWDIINPNPHRWKEGVKLLHHVLTVNKGNPDKLYETAEALARMYHQLLGDWARAAFWWRKAAELGGYDIEDFAIELAECYWKLGNRDMAVSTLSPLTEDESAEGIVIQLWADMGEIDKALQLAEDQARSGWPHIGYLAAGDACRRVGRYKEALAYYQKVLAVRHDPGQPGAGLVKRNHDRARANIEAVKVFDALDLAKIADGTYRAVSPAYAGPLHVAVIVKSGRIESVTVTRHEEKQFYSAITDATSQIIEKQSVKGIDMTSGATITAEAIVNATAKALASAMK